MTKEEAYAEGFCKTAEAYGVDPEQLYKAAGALDSITNGLGSVGRGLSDAYNSLSPDARRALIGGAAAGTGAYMLSDGYRTDRIKKALLSGLLAGGGFYGINKMVG